MTRKHGGKLVVSDQVVYFEGSFAAIEVHAVIPVMWTVKTVKTAIF